MIGQPALRRATRLLISIVLVSISGCTSDSGSGAELALTPPVTTLPAELMALIGEDAEGTVRQLISDEHVNAYLLDRRTDTCLVTATGIQGDLVAGLYCSPDSVYRQSGVWGASFRTGQGTVIVFVPPPAFFGERWQPTATLEPTQMVQSPYAVAVVYESGRGSTVRFDLNCSCGDYSHEFSLS